PAVERPRQIVSHGLNFRLSLRRKVPLDIKLSHGLAERSTGEIGATLPPWTLFRNSKQRFTGKCKTFVHERFGQEAGGLLDLVVRQPIFPCVEWFLCDERRNSCRRLRMPQVKIRTLLESRCFQQRRPVQTRSLLFQLLPFPQLRILHIRRLRPRRVHSGYL